MLRFPPATGGSGGGAPTDAGYLVTAANPELTNETVLNPASKANSGANSDLTSITGLTGTLKAPTQILDANGNIVLEFGSTSSADNYLKITNSSNGNPSIRALGNNDPSLLLICNDNGQVRIESTDGQICTFTPDTTGVNYIDIANADSGSSPVISVIGVDNDSGINLVSKGIESVYANNNPINTTLLIMASAVGNVTTGEDSLLSYTLPANTLGKENDTLEIIGFGTNATNSNNKTLKLYFQDELIFTTGVTTINGLSWKVTALITRIDATNQMQCTVYNGDTASVSNPVSVGFPIQNLATDLLIRFTGEAVATNDILQRGLIINLLTN